MQKTVGVIGGMGPDATVDFMSGVIGFTKAARDQDHVRMLVDNNPRVPCRQEALLGDGDDPGPVMADMARGLEAGGAEFLVMPCNTAHAFADAIRDAVSIPLLSILDVTVAACQGHAAVGILATRGCLDAGVYQKAFAASGAELVVPDESEMAELMELIFAIKAGDRSAGIGERMQTLAESLTARGATVVVGGCTEITLVLHDGMLSVPLVSSTDELARATAAICSGQHELPSG
ncbi:MAG: amino acid racemase [Woeseiaceae bacterium]|nr:amino acid racemase [Woeseiaceae bacterium]